MNNQQKFNELSAEIFSQLYDSFPIEKKLNIKDYPDFNKKENRDLFFATVKFYIDEKFIRCEQQFHGGVYAGVVLTSKGFSVLNAAPPEKFNAKSNIAIALKDAIANAKTASIKSLVSESIKLMVKMVLI